MRWTDCCKCKDNKPGFQIRIIFKIKRLFIIKVIINPKDNEVTIVLFNRGITNKEEH